MLRRVLVAFSLALALAACATVPRSPPEKSAEAPVMVLISIDGFRADYLDRGVTPTLSALAARGVRGEMRPSFPSKTFPNHYALVTGLRPDRNGIVDNNMVDPAIPGVVFAMANKAAVVDARWWNDAKPIWVSAEQQGVRTGTLFWPGSEAPIRGVRPTRYAAYDQEMPAGERVDRALAWLDLPAAERPRFLTLYFDAVDTAGHHSGPDSPEVNAAAADTDAAIARLLAGLRARNRSANLVIVADHGMAATPAGQVVYADDLVPMSATRTLTMGAFWALSPLPGHEAEVDKALIRPLPHMQCWRKAQIPARYHYGHHPRVPAYFCLAETGWEISTHAYRARHPNPDKGDHGFDPYAPEMQAIFVANGPAFRSGVRLATFDNVDVYPLLARVLGVRPDPGDGRLADVAAALAP